MTYRIPSKEQILWIIDVLEEKDKGTENLFK